MKINPVTNNREISITQSFGDTNTKLNTIFSTSDTTKTKEIPQTGLILENEKVPPKGSNSPEQNITTKAKLKWSILLQQAKKELQHEKVLK